MKIENIKFKAKRLENKENKEWVCGYFYQECDNTYIVEDRQKESLLNRNAAYEVDPSTVCMFTGLKDCDGKEIWEGDIIRNPEFPFEKRTVTWNDVGSSFMLIDKDEYENRAFSFLVLLKKWTVVGNKFDK